jgi:hypothetical protein
MPQPHDKGQGASSSGTLGRLSSAGAINTHVHTLANRGGSDATRGYMKMVAKPWENRSQIRPPVHAFRGQIAVRQRKGLACRDPQGQKQAMDPSIPFFCFHGDKAGKEAQHWAGMPTQVYSQGILISPGTGCVSLDKRAFLALAFVIIQG